ncbi:hypothetical protein [uncultured Fibrobacter sp.]|uniref:hypothetical protein n=1 Tax=uncultured Fibrobacter sp. TaxID=261512 RepID=UPI00262B0948|nr:hypothetical protein [uncultured Fibrobacter sp.]
MKSIKEIFLGRKIMFILIFFLAIISCFIFKIKQFSFCLDLKKCPVDNEILFFENYLDSLDLFVVKGGEGNVMDYFLYDGFRIYCVSDTSSLMLNAKGIWDGEFEGSSLVYLKPYIADDVLLFRIRKKLDLFYLVEVDENLVDITYWFFANYSCGKKFVN